MARIVVVTSHPPFAAGGHLVIAEALVDALNARNHRATLLLTPQNRFGRQGSAYLSNWLTDVGEAGGGEPVDQVISFRYPSYAVRHARHVCWLNHRMREYYDEWPRFSASLSGRNRVKEGMRRRLIHAADRYLLTRNVTRLVAQSRTIQERLSRWGGIPSEVVHPPPPPRPYRCDGYGDELLVASRLTPLKRIHLVLDALREPAAASVRCVIVGDGEEREALAARIDAEGLTSRVRLLGHVSDAELVGLLATCRAVCFPAAREDYGLVTVEAFASGKPVVTCSDSGGPTELVEDGVNGFVVDPAAPALAGAIARLMNDARLAERLGGAARGRVASISWDRALERLLLV